MQLHCYGSNANEARTVIMELQKTRYVESSVAVVVVLKGAKLLVLFPTRFSNAGVVVFEN